MLPRARILRCCSRRPGCAIAYGGRSCVRADTRRLGELPRSIVEHHRANGDARPLRGLQAHRLPEFETATTRTTRAIRLRVSGKIERADSGKHCKHYGASAEISQ